MKRHTKRELEHFKCWHEAAHLVEWMNAEDRFGSITGIEKRSNASLRRIVELIECLKTILALQDDIYGGAENWTKEQWAAKKQRSDELWPRYKHLVLKFETMADDYPSTPSWFRDTNDLDIYAYNCGRRPEGEFMASQLVISLARSRVLHRLRLCVCGKWFYGKRDNQNTCGAACCRHKRYAQTENFKKHRALYMRWYYQMYQSPKAPRRKISFEKWLGEFQRGERNGKQL